jgi:2-deoxy-D-gluconate 3-dehydrogenase
MGLEVFDVTGKAVLITGAGRGIGKGIAQVLAEAGADVAINALTPRYVEGVAAEISGASGRQVVPVIADVTKTDGAQDAVDATIQAFGRIDVLINNLGDSIRKPLVALPDQAEGGDALSEDEISHVMDVNLTEAIFCTRAVGPHMLERRSGKIINISSWTAKQGGGDMVVYSIAKTGLAGFTRAQALEWAPYGVHVNCIAPGLFPDPVTVGEDGVQRTAERAARIVPLGRPGDLREVGYLALYLASAASDYMTGQTLYIDGGMSL